MELTNTQKKSKKAFVGWVLLHILIFLSLLIYFSVRWCLSNWQHLSMDEFIYTMTAKITGTGNGMIGKYMMQAFLPCVGVFALAVVFLAMARKFKFAKPAALLAVCGCLLVGGYKGVYRFWDVLDVGEYVKSQLNASTFIEDNYVDPATAGLEFPETKRNVIYIFLESTEMTFTNAENGGAKADNIIPELTSLAQENEDFSGTDSKLNGARSTYGTTWTMGGMFAQTCGLPLQTQLTGMTEFYPNITTIGDVLEDEGYNQVLMIGSDAAFGNRDVYFTQHGNYEIDDYYYAIDQGWIDEDYKVWWGYEDEKLFEFARKKLGTLSQESEPFNLTLLTVDTHFEDGYVCDLCDDTYDVQYSNVFACASRQVAAFVKWCQTQDWYDNTTIVINGDHPTMDADYCDDVADDYVRQTYTCYINSAVDPASTVRRLYTTLDSFPTTLAAMGVTIPGDRLALGTNLFSDTKTLREEYKFSTLNEEFKKRSNFMKKLSDTEGGSVELKIKTGDLPSVEVAGESYHRDDDYATATVTEVKNLSDDQTITKMEILASGASDGGKGLKVTMEKQDDGTYTGGVPTSSLKSRIKEKVYFFVYITLDDGTRYEAGKTSVEVEED